MPVVPATREPVWQHLRKPIMFMVSAEASDTIRTAFMEKGEWPAVAELRRFYRIDDNEST